MPSRSCGIPPPATTSPRQPALPHRRSRAPPRASFLRRQESRGARRGASPSPIVRAPPKSVRPEPVEGSPHRQPPHHPPPRASFLRRQESRGVRRGASPSPIARALPKSVRPEPVEGSPHRQPPHHPPPARVIPAKAGIQRGEARGVSHSIAPPLPTEGAPPKSVRPEPVEACPEGTRRGSPTTDSPRITPSPSPPREPHPVALGRPTDTALLPPLQCLGYRLPMAVTISHRNQNTADPHASGRPSPVVGGMVRIDGQRWIVKHQEGLCIPLQKSFLDL